jgi:uncharacterized membrane protein (UPF0127 family)
MNLPRMHIEAGEHRLHAYVARSEEERALGLMHRQELGENEAMLFMCDAPDLQSFWMKDTPLPLSAAFVADDGTILQIEHMEPQSLEPHASREPVRFVLEVLQGWFDEHGVKPGDRLVAPAFLAEVSR